MISLPLFLGCLAFSFSFFLFSSKLISDLARWCEESSIIYTCLLTHSWYVLTVFAIEQEHLTLYYIKQGKEVSLPIKCANFTYPSKKQLYYAFSNNETLNTHIGTLNEYV